MKNNGTMQDEIRQCSRCKRFRRSKFLIERKNYSGKIVLRCKKRSVCHSTAKRVNPAYKKSVEAHGKKGSKS